MNKAILSGMKEITFFLFTTPIYYYGRNGKVLLSQYCEEYVRRKNLTLF